MAAPRKCHDELRERATRMAVDARRDPATRTGALKRIGEHPGINPETLRNWVIQAEIEEVTGRAPRRMTPPGWPSLNDSAGAAPGERDLEERVGPFFAAELPGFRSS